MASTQPKNTRAVAPNPPPRVAQQQGEEPVAAELIAQSIISIDEGMKAIMKSGLRFEAIVILLAASSGVGKPDIRRVLHSLDSLRKDYLMK